MRSLAAACAFVLFCACSCTAAEDGVFESTKAANDIAPSTDPDIPFWRAASSVYADKGNFGEPRARFRTEIRSRWTEKYLYLLFVCPYDELYLKPSPSTATETFALWNWDVAEAFIGSDFQDIKRYKEFEVSPHGEWVDLDIDLNKPHHEDGWTWNSGFVVSARIDATAKVWYAVMRIPFSALQNNPPAAAQLLRINLFRSQGPPSSRVQVVWQPTMNNSFHVPERFGLMRLVKPAAR
jgi:hypothetical protein